MSENSGANLDEVLARMRSIAQAVMGEPVPDVHETPWDWTISGTSAAQLAHIEAFQPSTVLALLDEVNRLRSQLTITEDLPAIAADMLNAWYAPSNPTDGTAEDYRELKHRTYGQRDFDGMVAVLSVALWGEQR